jgi:hypothetical protein
MILLLSKCNQDHSTVIGGNRQFLPVPCEGPHSGENIHCRMYVGQTEPSHILTI